MPSAGYLPRERKNKLKKNNFIEKTILSFTAFVREAVFSEEIAARRGFLQEFNAGIKAFSFFSVIICALFLRNEQLLIALYALCLALTAASNINTVFFLKRTLLFIPFFTFLVVLPSISALFTPGDALWPAQICGINLSITRQGIDGAVLIMTRVTVSVSFVILLSLTTRHFELLKALKGFGIPAIFVMTAGMCYRYIFLLAELIERTFLAVKSRTGGLIKAAHGRKITAWNMAMLWRRSYTLNENVYAAMLSRGFSGEPVALNSKGAGAGDYIRLAVFITVSVLFLAADFLLRGHGA